MQLLEWSDTRLRFKIKEIIDNVSSDLDLTDFTTYLLEIQFSDDSTLEVEWEVDDDTWTVTFDILSEDTENKEWALTADLWGTKWAKKVRFNPTTIKWKVLNSVKIPDVLQDS
jgi:hypothetical protein